MGAATRRNCCVGQEWYGYNHRITVYGAFEPGSSEDNWSDENRDPRIQKNWANIAAVNHYNFNASSKLDGAALMWALIQSFGLVLSVVGLAAQVTTPAPASGPK
jgi:hypothetical protein